MQFLVLSRRKIGSFSKADFDRLMPDEAAQARRFYAEGFTRQIWHRSDEGGVCQIVEEENEEAVREKLSLLPFNQAGMLEIDVIALAPYLGFTDK